MDHGIAEAAARMQAKVGSGREVKHLAEHLLAEERVVEMATGAYGKGMGLLVLTDQRLLFVLHGVVSRQTEDFPLAAVSSVEWSSGLVFGEVKVHASGNTAKITNVQKVDGKRLVDRVREVLAEVRAPRPAGVSGGDVAGLLRQLGELRDAGLITPAEFDAKRAELLARM